MKPKELEDLKNDFAEAVMIGITKTLNLPEEENQKALVAIRREFDFILAPFLT